LSDGTAPRDHSQHPFIHFSNEFFCFMSDGAASRDRLQHPFIHFCSVTNCYLGKETKGRATFSKKGKTWRTG